MLSVALACVWCGSLPTVHHQSADAAPITSVKLAYKRYAHLLYAILLQIVDKKYWHTVCVGVLHERKVHHFPGCH